jgi:shikimate kinase
VPRLHNSSPNLVLIGYRGTGKTAVGARLAQILGRELVDLDQVLVAEAGRSIPEIVAREGWPGFRRREKELVARYGTARGLVLATGGGVILDPENVQTLAAHGIIIWLTADPDTIRERLSRDQAQDPSRPSLTGRDTLSEIEEVLRSRELLYRKAAQITIDTTHHSIPQVVERILAAVGQLEEK